jgi:2-methylisocitrate lyase-like PEP mutase family enzyme
MSDAKKKAGDFRALHVPGRPLILFNVWDPGSAKAVAGAGAKALATGSWSVASACGYQDGEQVPLDLVIDNLRRIAGATELPVSIDIESGYGKTPEDVARTIGRTLGAGAVGCNLEDSFPENGELRETAEQVKRIRQARAAAEAAGIPYFINVRTDVFFRGAAGGAHDAAMVRSAAERARAYAGAGADGLFAPGLTDLGLISSLVEASPLPLNVMFSEKTPAISSLAQAGVARVSHGPGPYLAAMKRLAELAREAMAL